MIRSAGPWLSLALVIVCASALPAQDSVPDTRPVAVLSRAQAEAELALLEAAIREKWAYLEDKEKTAGLDLGKLVAAAKARLEDSNPRARVHEIVLELVASLKDGHANVFTLGVARPQRRWPFHVVETTDGFVVVARNGAEPALGERLVGIGSRGVTRSSVADELARLERRTLASSDQARRRFALRALHETDQPRVVVELERPEGGRHDYAFDTVRMGEGPVTLELLRMRDPAWAPAMVASGVARIRAPTFAVEDWAGWLNAPVEPRESFVSKTKQSIDRCFATLRDLSAKTLVLDLRGNAGGTDILGVHLAKHLLAKTFVYFKLSGIVDGKWTTPHGYEHEPFPSDQRFDGPLAILVDEDCFSVTDNLLRCLVDNRPDVIVVGRRTNGGTGAPSVIARLPRSETWVTLCTMRVFGPNGVMIEGRGTQPTIPVRWSTDDFLERRDPDLEAAVRALTKPGASTGR